MVINAWQCLVQCPDEAVVALGARRILQASTALFLRAGIHGQPGHLSLVACRDSCYLVRMSGGPHAVQVVLYVLIMAFNSLARLTRFSLVEGGVIAAWLLVDTDCQCDAV